MKAAADAPAAAGRVLPGERPRAVLFDLDGTLVDSGPDIAAAINAMLADLGRAPYPVERILEWVGDGAPQLVARTLTDSLAATPSAAQTAHGFARFQAHYAAAVCVHSRPYPLVRELLEALQSAGIARACVTNKPEHLSHALLAALDLAPLFDVVVGGDTLARRKPHPEPIEHACRSLHVAVTEAVYVGDSLTDCRAAAAAGVPMIAVSYGYHQGADLTAASAAVIIDSFAALPALLGIPENLAD